MKGDKFEIRDNWDGTITKTLDSDDEFVYNILARGNVPAEDSIVDYWYFQHDTHKENPDDPNETSLVDALKAENVGEWSFCSGTCTAMVLAITYGDKSITPKSVLYWGDDDDEDNREVNWTWKMDKNGKYVYDENGERIDNGLRAWEQDKYDDQDKQVYDNTGKGENDGYGAIDGSDIEKDRQYLKNLKTYLAAGQPVIIHVKGSSRLTEHFVVAVGVEAGVSLEEATFGQLVIFDPATDKKTCITTIANSYDDYELKDYRMITPYLYDFDKNDFVRDENGEKTTDSYYVDPVKKEDDSIVPSKTGRMIKEIIKSINVSNLPDYEKVRIAGQMIRTFTGEDDVAYDILSAAENAQPTEFLPVVYNSGKTSGEVVDINNGLSVTYTASGVPSSPCSIVITVTNLINGEKMTKEVQDWAPNRIAVARISNMSFSTYYFNVPVGFYNSEGQSVGGIGTVAFDYIALGFNYKNVKNPYYVII